MDYLFGIVEFMWMILSLIFQARLISAINERKLLERKSPFDLDKHAEQIQQLRRKERSGWIYSYAFLGLFVLTFVLYCFVW
jgi:hypothetical protein